MANLFEQAKQMMAMRRETKRIQAEIERITSSYTNGGITAVARGDFTLTSIKVEQQALTEILAGKPERFETMLLNVINGALSSVKKQTQEQMAKMMKGGDLASLMDG